MKHVTPRSAIFAIQNPIGHMHTHSMAHPILWWDPDAPDSLSGETLDPLEKNHPYKTTVGTGVKVVAKWN